MAKKVTLDTLHTEELEIPLPARTPPVEEENGEELEGRPVLKWLWIAVFALVLLVTAGGVSYWLIAIPKTAPQVSNHEVPPATTLPKKLPTAEVNNFIITIHDDKGKYLVVTCDLTFELSAGQDAILKQNTVEIRKIIYEILKKTSLVSLKEPKIRSILKEEINTSLSVLLGQDAIKNIYFTKFTVL